MSESSSIESKARDILNSSSHEELSTIVSHLFMRQETDEYKSAKAMYDFFVDNIVNPFALMLLTLYQCSSNGVVRFRSTYLLSDTLTRLRNRNITLSPVTLHKIKPLLISCLTMEVTKESDIKIFARIVSFVAYNVGEWNELRDCILSLQPPLKAFHVFVSLPVVTEKTIIEQVMQKVLEEATKLLLNPELDRAEHWSLAVETLAKTGIHLSDSEKRQKLIELVLKSSNKLVQNGREQFLARGLQDLKKFLARDSYSKVQLNFVGSLAFQISEACWETLELCNKISTEILQTSVEIPEKFSKYDHGSGFERDWYDYLKNLSSLELFRIFASTDLEDRSRELAIRRLNVLLSQIKEDVPSDHISVLIQLQPLIISCLEEEGLSDGMFKVLGVVVDQVICQMIIREEKIWEGSGLSDFIVSQSKTRFPRAVYIFQCFTMRLEDDKFFIPMMDTLLPEISSRLNPPSESLLDNSAWVLAFAGAFSAIIQMIEFPNKESLKEIAYKMIDSVREFVERRMEVGIVRRPFRDVESIVKKQLEWYDTSEYKFVKGLLWRLYAIRGMKWESKIVLWRINLILESRMAESSKELPESELDSLDWINHSEDKESNEELDEGK